MALQRTLCIVKPDAVEKHTAGSILQRVEESGFEIRALRMTRLARAEAEGFYEIHRQRPFFGELVQFMTRSPVIVAVLERDDAVTGWRELMGATDPAKAAPGTLRARFAQDMTRNATHGSDSPASATRELGFFFGAYDVV